MRHLGSIAMFISCASAFAQVELDVPIHFSGQPEDRSIIGLAPPVSESAAITVEVASSGQVHWATATFVNDTLSLTVVPPVITYRDGLLLRFASVGVGQMKRWINVQGLSAHPVIRHDGRPVDATSLGANSVAEVLFHDGDWILLNASYSVCPSGSVSVNERLCMEATTFPGLKIYEAINRCGDRGGRLCTWDEYVAGCTLAGGELNGLFDEWEWIDDSSNHTHTANQAGRFTCQSQRTANAITLIVGDTRCCYHPR